MRKLVFVSASLAAILAGSAMAADMPVKYKAPPPAPVFSWTGFYVGVNAGYAWGDSDFTSVFSCPDAACAFINPANLAFVSALGTGSARSDGFTGGVQIGANWQSGSVVLGVEADFNAFRLDASRAASGLLPAGAGQTATVTTSIETDWLFTLRGRLGFTVTPTFLVYATGGLAVTDLQLSNSYVDNGVGAPAIVAGTSSSSETKAGWTVGGGFEWATSFNWTVKAEYLYLDFGSISTTASVAPVIGGVTPNTLATSADLTAHVARLGINYKF
jgi:outer membrane immunogenic protein